MFNPYEADKISMEENASTQNKRVVSARDSGPNHKLHESYQGQSFKYITVAALLQGKKGRFYELICLTSSLTPILNR